MWLFAVVGCADLTLSGDYGAPHWMQRTGDVAVFGCNGSSSITWQLTCDGDQWIGDRRVCPDISAAGIPFTPLSSVIASCYSNGSDSPHRPTAHFFVYGHLRPHVQPNLFNTFT